MSESYREAYASRAKYQTINDMASKAFRVAAVRHRVDMLLRQQTEAMMRDSIAIRRHVFAGLLKESTGAEKASDRISALVSLGKIDIVGMFREIHGIERIEDRPPEVIEAELREKLAPLLITSNAPLTQSIAGEDPPGDQEERSDSPEQG